MVWSLCSPRDSQESFPTSQFKSIKFSVLSLLYGPTLTFIHGYWKKQSIDYRNFSCKILSLLFNMLSRLVITFLPRSKLLLIPWPQSPSAVILEPRKIVFHYYHFFFPSICHEVLGREAMIFVFWVLSFKTDFHSPLSSLFRGSSVPLHFLP